MSNPDPDFLDPFDDCPWLPARDLLARLNFQSPPPASVSDAETRGRLWELLYALSARRIFFYNTNHLSDREFYIWLHETWLPEETADIPPQAEFNCHVDVADGGNASTTWLRYYADAEERSEWALDFPEETLPEHVDPAHDRDRWLPESPKPPPTSEESPWMADENEEDDPLGLHAVDREIREQKSRAAAAANNEDADEQDKRNTERPPAEGNLADELACEPDSWRRPLDELSRQGVVLLPPDELTDESLPSKVWELLHELACRGFFVLHSDHLNDRELYAALWRDSLREPAMLPGRCRNGGWFHDFTGSGSEEHTALWLRYYASDEDRARFAKEDWFRGPLPPRETPPCHRDWRLPKGPF